MERLTKRDTNGQAMMDCEKCKADWTGKHGKPMVDCTALYCRNRLLGRLVEHEDTGLTPKEVTALGELFNYALKESKTLTEQLTLLKHIRKLAEADKEGRCIIPPCKVGETVYFVNAKQILEFAVVGYAVDETGISWVYSENVDKIGNTNERTFSPDRFGKNTFFTREEAEKALQEMEGKKDG
jgi:hypothetical protein